VPRRRGARPDAASRAHVGMLGAGLEPWANTELGPWADLLGAGTSRALEVSLPQSSEGYETPSVVDILAYEVTDAT
jgi:hypothetical protein